MRLGNLDGRLVIVRDDRAFDVEELSGGRFGPHPQEIYPQWDEFDAWAAAVAIDGFGAPVDPTRLGPPVPSPRQILAVGLNYRNHAAEAGFAVPEQLPPVFTKFVSAITGPYAVVALPPGDVDWEVELAVVMGRTARTVHPDDAWAHVAGLTIAQDLSERRLQMAGPAPQFGLAKSHPGFLPLGPLVVTPDEFVDPDDLALSASVNGETVQDATTADLIFPVPMLIARLSEIVTLYPGDLILTGTPAGVGFGRTPARYLTDGDMLVSRIAGIGEMRQLFTDR